MKGLSSWLMVSLLTVLLSWQVYSLGVIHAENGVSGSYSDYLALKQREDWHQTRFDTVNEKLRSREEQLYAAEQQLEIELLTNRELRSLLTQASSEQRDLDEQVRFYEGIVGTDKVSGGARVDSFVMYRIGESRSFVLDVTMVRSGQSAQRIKGQARLDLVGSLEGEVSELILFADGNNDHRKVGFKHFQVIRDEFELPEGFMPTEFKLKIDVIGRRKYPIDATYQWDDVLSR
ncbi:MAG: hypothetical protein ACI9OO_002091 [Bacteroidia bacterium]|jgi:hypothetical protein